ncbi:hypothetical protein H2199_000306 [Coniosporium tulheliwenetii]|uniref:Uncharacterized protein n=1 Tax=Coniosporium tulheliwenetii TaxID=3383036 RepID=A0ACC2ZPN0_9PEZI|nr:hypothetical protein H2199_000306 [Cladosporium sp. JES 115]
MQSTGVRAFKALASKIHPQLPLNARESQQLLGLLTTSFRQHLDREYPASQLRDNQAAVQDGRGQPITPSDANAHRSSHSTANHHLESILTNPMFTTKPKRRSGSSPRAESAHTHTMRLRHVISDPLQWFEEKVAGGTANIVGATLCLESLRAPAYRDLNAGTRVLVLLKSVGLHKSEAFYKHQPFLQALAFVLVADGQQRLLWSILNVDPANILETTLLDHQDVARWKAYLLKHFVRAELSHPQGQDHAVALILAASSSGNFSGREVNLAVKVFTKHTYSYPFAGSVKDFDALLDLAKQWSAELNNLTYARLALRHPQQPSPQPGLEYLQKIHLSPEAVREMQKTRRQSLIQLSLDVARLLLAQGRFEDGAWVLEFAQNNFSEELDLSSETQPVLTTSEKARENELNNLRLLDGLALD